MQLQYFFLKKINFVVGLNLGAQQIKAQPTPPHQHHPSYDNSRSLF
jgi:hypothetical protein